MIKSELPQTKNPPPPQNVNRAMKLLEPISLRVNGGLWLLLVKFFPTPHWASDECLGVSLGGPPLGSSAETLVG